METAVLEARALLDRGSTLAQVPMIREAAALLEAIAAEGDAAGWVSYHLGYARYRLGALRQNEKKEAAEHLAAAVEHLRDSARLLPASGEPRALASTCYGMQIRYSPLRIPWLGERKSRALAEAEYLEPENPRVVLLRALQLWTTPRYAGGDRERALDGFGRAVECFETWTSTEPLGPEWGHAQALAYQGMALGEMGEPERALDSLRGALRIAPEYRWVKHVLLPKMGVVTG
jgi:tetratricopeptide (TPR) repeat protein